MNLDFSGKVVVITGGAKGIGEATARKFCECGAAVTILDSDVETGKSAAIEIAKEGGSCDFLPCHVNAADEVASAISDLIQKNARIDVLVNNAGIQDYGDVVSTTEEAWDKLIDINLKGAFLVSKYAIPHMLEHGGAIVILGSVQSFTAISNSVAYVTSKHALLGLTRAMSVDYAQKNIRVNCVCPGSVDTPMLRWAASLAPDPEAVIRNCDRMHPLGRIARPEEIANAIVYLSSPLASFITGAALVVDGGMLVPTGGMMAQEGGTGSTTQK